MSNEDIDLSDCPEVTPEMLANAVVRKGLSADTQSDKSLQQVMDEIGEGEEESLLRQLTTTEAVVWSPYDTHGAAQKLSELLVASRKEENS